MFNDMNHILVFLCSAKTFSTCALATSQLTGPFSSSYCTGSGRPNLINDSIRSTDADFEAFKIGNWDSELISVYTPYLEVTKFEILEDGLRACEALGLNFDEVYKRTNTSYKPYPSGNSDYKSAASVERIEAFIRLGRPDPVEYADETGPVSWEVAKSHVEKVLAEHIS